MQKHLIENYLEANTDHCDEISLNTDFLEKIFRMEMVLQGQTRKVWNDPKGHLSPAQEKKLFKLAEDFVFGGEAAFRVSDKSLWEKIFSDARFLSYFQDLVLFISEGETGNKKTPSYLREIIQKKIFENTKAKKSITILIRDRLKLLKQDMNNLFEIPLLQEAVASRYAGTISSGSNVLQFLNKQEDGTEIIFQALKDGEDTVTISLNLKKSSVLPSTVTLRKNNRVIQKNNSTRKSIVYNRLTAGVYQIELEKGKDHSKRVIDIDLITDSGA